MNKKAITPEAILGAGNLRKECRQVVRNKDSASVDGKKKRQLLAPIPVGISAVGAEVVSKGHYEPQPVYS